MNNTKIILTLVEKRFTEIIASLFSLINCRCIMLVVIACGVSSCDSSHRSTAPGNSDDQRQQIAKDEWRIQLKSGVVSRSEILTLMKSHPTEAELIDRLGKPTTMYESGEQYQLIYWRTDRPTAFEEGGHYLVSLTFYSENDRIVDWQTDYAEVEKLSEGQVQQYIEWSKKASSAD